MLYGEDISTTRLIHTELLGWYCFGLQVSGHMMRGWGVCVWGGCVCVCVGGGVCVGLELVGGKCVCRSVSTGWERCVYGCFDGVGRGWCVGLLVRRGLLSYFHG